jgi:hypothetical protein
MKRSVPGSIGDIRDIDILELEHSNRDKKKKMICPLIKNPLKECYCAKMDSLNTEETIYYCGKHYSRCGIYQRYQKEQ